jgi:hypothetical protein
VDQKPLVTEQIDAGEHLIREFIKWMPVQAAFWLRESDSDEWYLYLASDRINDSNFDLAYAEVLRIVPAGHSLWLDPFQVKVVGTETQVARVALDFMKKYPGKFPTRYKGGQFGDLSSDEVVMYPLPLPVTA